ncbi:PREDICTED: FBD-associated F-box protein At3g49020-like [Camelina sativa]|uniref:FBD-associated F-box protein At3g49020-like n=1 Tax=Camelina sativa TaxID=90675 RepID=A0ABM1QFK3_CAMSA|nr:PREDICTED: FBD-associated F-box protein At3g49020-like [Camelina sativa]
MTKKAAQCKTKTQLRVTNCKIGGLGMCNRGVVSEDRISELLEPLLVDILSSLPTKTAIATSGLSRSWKSIWTMLPNLEFDSCHYNHQTFSEDVSRTLILHKAPVLESLKLEVGYKCDAMEIGLLVGIAFARHVRKLVLIVFSKGLVGYVKFPGVLCRCNNTLEILELTGTIILDLPSPVCFKSLKALKLSYVHFKDEESVSKLLSGCPILEDLVVNRFRNADVATFTIALPSLHRLTLEDQHYANRAGGYLINAPSLKYLNINGFDGLEFCLIQNAPELMEAKVSDVYDIKNENILETLIQAKRLSLDLSPLKVVFPIGKIFYQLLSLELHTNKYGWLYLLSLMLDSSPKLQILKLTDPYHYHNKDSRFGWSQPKRVPECLLFHLETFEWIGYESQLEDEKGMATYILKNARCLEKATLSTKPIESKELDKLEKRRQMLYQLATEVRASDSCHLVLDSKTAYER